MFVGPKLTIRAAGASTASTPVEVLASYFKDLAARGLGCATNNTSIAYATGMDIITVRWAKAELVAQKRLVCRWGVWTSIDGYRFNVAPKDELDALKVVLRREYGMVCDARVLERPNLIPKGPVTHLILGSRKVTLEEAKSIAAKLEGRGNE